MALTSWNFSWTHILELIRIDDPLKRAFYENECLKGNWSKRQLQRQIGSLLFERTGLSKNKAAVIARARRQEPRKTIEDLIRDPYVLEFTGVAELPQDGVVLFKESAQWQDAYTQLKAILATREHVPSAAERAGVRRARGSPASDRKSNNRTATNPAMTRHLHSKIQRRGVVNPKRSAG